jgi:hypothetical protein
MNQKRRKILDTNERNIPLEVIKTNIVEHKGRDRFRYNNSR